MITLVRIPFRCDLGRGFPQPFFLRIRGADVECDEQNPSDAAPGLHEITPSSGREITQPSNSLFEGLGASNILLGNFGSTEGKPEDVVEVRRNVHIKAPRKIPRLHDPVVVQSQSLSMLKVADKLGYLRLEVVSHRQPVRRRRPDDGNNIQCLSVKGSSSTWSNWVCISCHLDGNMDTNDRLFG